MRKACNRGRTTDLEGDACGAGAADDRIEQALKGLIVAEWSCNPYDVAIADEEEPANRLSKSGSSRWARAG